MNLNFFIETLSLGIKNIYLHKLRSLLTTMGIIIGVAAVIIMVAIGEGTKQAALEQVRQLGANNVLVRSIVPPESNDASARSTSRQLEYGLKRMDLRNLKSTFRFPDPADPDIVIDPSGAPSPLAYVVPIRDTQLRVRLGDKLINANAIGTTADVFEVINLHLDRGRYFTNVDYNGKAAVCVLGATAAQQMFPFQDPLGQFVTIGSGDNGVLPLPVQVIGVLEKTGLRSGGFSTRDIDLDIYMPLSLVQSAFSDTLTKRTSSSQERKTIELSEIWLRSKSFETVEAVAAIANNVVALNHNAKALDFEVKAPIEILRNAEQINRIFNFIMVGIASFALVVGGIGIMNIMLASVTERTREIGIRRALGAKRRDITLQFLIETTLISVCGGAVGIAIGAGSALLLPVIVLKVSGQNYPTVIAIWSIFGSFFISALIGIGFGLYPAVKAARMDPIEALRYE